MPENSRGSTKRRGAGRPFAPGVSGNPGGRPKIVAEIRELARRQTDSAMRTLVAVMESGKSDSARVAAAVALLDRGWGKPTQAMDVSGTVWHGALPRGFFEAVVSGDPSQLAPGVLTDEATPATPATDARGKGRAAAP